MKLNRRHKIWLALASLLIIVNVCLIYFDKEQKVAKTTHVKEWTKTTEQDMYEFIHTEGVLDFSTENYVYFDDQLGEFQSFLVEKGEEIRLGESLYTYQIHNYYETQTRLESEIEKVNSEILAIEAAISKMESYQPPSSAEGSGLSQSYGEDTSDPEESFLIRFVEAINGAQDVSQAEIIKEQYITEKEKELEQKNAELNSVESQLSELTQTGDTITVESPYEGIVSGVSETLEDPLLTIQSDELVVKSELTEQEHLDVESGLSVYIEMKESGQTMEGKVEKVSQIPENLNLKGNSKYSFLVSLEEMADDAHDEGSTDLNNDMNDDEGDDSDLNGGLNDDVNVDENNDNMNNETNNDMNEASDENQFAPGYHADLEVVTEESPNATVIHQDALNELSIWKMINGELIREPVQTGIQMDKKVEIEEGLETGDWIAKHLEDKFVSHSPYITSLQVSKVKWNQLKNDRWFRDMMIGIISR
ncbi:MAG TPA: HlyD family efflux transporter periplasmic adaptor subunit [Candidatus Avamphibacillus sp.]|nr:HlyD family efflux transporter periplasmic adaptor subunit [Candidatus Avamphibacillus sp.]